MTDTTAEQQLTLQEQIVLLILNDEKGSLDGLHISYGLNAAVLAELALSNRISIEGEVVLLQDATPTGEEALDMALEHLAKSRRPQSLQWWIECVYPDIFLVKEVLMRQLVARGIVRQSEMSLLWGANLNVYPTIDPQPEHDLRDQIGIALLSNEAPARVAILLALLEGSHSLDLALTRLERMLWKESVQEMAASHPIGKALGRALASVVHRDSAAMPSFALVSHSIG